MATLLKPNDYNEIESNTHTIIFFYIFCDFVSSMVSKLIRYHINQVKAMIVARINVAVL